MTRDASQGHHGATGVHQRPPPLLRQTGDLAPTATVTRPDHWDSTFWRCSMWIVKSNKLVHLENDPAVCRIQVYHSEGLPKACFRGWWSMSLYLLDAKWTLTLTLTLSLTLTVFRMVAVLICSCVCVALWICVWVALCCFPDSLHYQTCQGFDALSFHLPIWLSIYLSVLYVLLTQTRMVQKHQNCFRHFPKQSK